jgi:ElaB/YqjD/DUF883 family membrane-anchored ribosome-binding protein
MDKITEDLAYLDRVPSEPKKTVRDAVKTLVDDVEELIHRVADAVDPEITRLRAKVAARVSSTRRTFVDGAGRALGSFNGEDTESSKRTWRALGLAALSGVALGLVAGNAARSRRHHQIRLR